ncbi:MAG: hypothetical protein V5B39_09875 [Accumulibacter sp.]|jgi:hypothetical protein|uniref:hypothetical protein n=1 Tax=Accumulibacter sp. TaxID=2053492 RepID=UPI002FC32CBD
MTTLFKWLYRSVLLALIASAMHFCGTSHLYFDEGSSESKPLKPSSGEGRQR